MGKRVNKYFAAIDYVDKTLLELSTTNNSVSTASFAGIIGAPVGLACGSADLTFSFIYGISKTFLKTKRKKEANTTKLYNLQKVSLVEQKKISKALPHTEISHEEFALICDKAEKSSKLKEYILTTKRQRGDREKIN